MTYLTTRMSFITIVILTFLLPACSSQNSMSEAEQKVILSSAFGNHFNAHDQVGDVHSQKDSYPASRPFHVNDITEAIALPVRDCTTPGLYEVEKQMALNEAAADPSGATLPVKFSYSFGRKHDVIAKYANTRAALSASNPGVSYIPVGNKKGPRHGRSHFYYEADNSEVVRQYSTGERCFFSTIKINDLAGHSLPGDQRYDFIDLKESDLNNVGVDLSRHTTTDAKLKYLKHIIHYMYYGYCKVGRCAPDQAFAGEYANRLFNEIPSLDENGDPQIIKLYMADLRSEQMQHDIVRLSEDTTRGLEIDSSINNILNVCEVHKNYYDVTKNLSLPKEVNGFEFSPINGAVQLLNNILSHDVDGTLLSSQYTPIVIDLDGNGVQTSSVRWGTFFNMAHLQASSEDLAHRTAWIGGDYEDYNNGSLYDSRVNLDVRLTAKDGFLVVPDDNGQVASSAQMFGDNITVHGQQYENGFLALQAFANKSCDPADVTQQYVGPWDGDIYENQLKVWVDKNRNGVSDAGEIKGLRELGIAAINACHIVHADEEDAFGNGTHLRSAVLMQGPYPNLLNRPEEIIYQLQYGQGYEGEPSYFHLAIDLIFQVKEDQRCSGQVARVQDSNDPNEPENGNNNQNPDIDDMEDNPLAPPLDPNLL